MKSKSFTFLSITMAVSILNVTLENVEAADPAKSAAAALPPCCQEAAANTNSALSGKSIYQLTSSWTNDAGKTVQLRELRGRPQVVAMIFTSCQGACPLLVQQMRQLSDALPPSARTNAGFLLVTFDPKRDTPKVLNAYRATRNLPENQWTLLQGSEDDVRELALVLGVKYRQDANGQFIHSNLITILNADGEIAFQKSGLEDSTAELAAQLNRLMKP